MEQGKIIGIILLCAAITFSLRALPFFMFKGKKQMPEKVCCLAVFSLRTDWDLHRSQKAGIGICFFSVTVPYVIGAIVYYVSFFREIRKANRMIREMQYTKQQ